jgi:hypothetical protein
MATAPPAANGKAPAVAARPFIVGSRFSDDFSYDQSKALTTSTQRLPDLELDTDGFTAGLYLLVENTSVNNATVTAAFKEDGPLNVLEIVQLVDTNNKPVLGPMTGHDLYECVKFGGYHEQDDAKASPAWSVTTGTGSTGGSFTFVQYLPIEIVHRTSLGSLQNKSASAVFRLQLTLAAVGTVFVTAPATSSTVRVRVQQFGWLDADASDIKGNVVSSFPPALNSIQYWDKQTFTFSSGSMNQRLNPFSGGIRNLIIELRDSNLTRSGNENDFPDPLIFASDKVQISNRLRTVWKHLIGEDWDYTGGPEVIPVGTTVNDGNKRDLGIWPIPFNKDFGLRPGAEQSFGYLWVSAATTLMLKGTVGSGSASHTFNVFVNSVQPANGDPKTLTGGR